MTHLVPAPEERCLIWWASSLKDLRSFPARVRREVGFALSAAQFGGKHASAKPWVGGPSGVYEVVEDFDGDTYRAVYTVRFAESVYVVHCFQKKSPKGIKTAGPDKQLIEKRLKDIRGAHEKNYSKKEQ